MFMIPTAQEGLQKCNPFARRRMSHGRDEAGVVLVIYTLAIVTVLLFAALAVDLGNIAQTKQHSQDAADAAALSAVWDLASIVNDGSAANIANDESQAVTDVDNYFQHNYPQVQTPLTTTSCAPGSLPSVAGVTQSTQTDCVGFYPASTPNTIIVVIPAQNVNFTFGRVGGNTSQAVSAMAEASLTSPGGGATLPFAFCIDATSPSTNCASAPAYGLGCLKTGSHGAACTSFSVGSGDFGGVYSPRYLIYPGTAGNGGNDPVLKTDIDEGIDHPLLVNPNAPSQSDNICDYTTNGNTPGCTGTPEYNNVAPYSNGDAVVTTPGQELNESGDALFDGYTWSSACSIPFTPRLNHPNGFQASGVCSTDNPQPNGFNPTCPCLRSATAASFGDNTYQLNGVHVADYLISSRTDAATVTKDSDSVIDTSITAADQGSVVTGTGIPAGTYVGTVTPGSGFLLSSSPTSQVDVLATANGTSVTITTNSSTPTSSSLYKQCYQGQGPAGDTSPSPTGDPIDYTSGGQNVWSSGDPTYEDGCLSTQIESLATSAACSTTPVPASCKIFSSSIAESPRFGMVPVVENVHGTKGDAIASFDDVFIYQAAQIGGKVDSISAWIFPSWMVQTGPNNGGAGGHATQGPLTANLCSLSATPGPNC